MPEWWNGTAERKRKRVRLTMASLVALAVVDVIASVAANTLRDLRGVVRRRGRLPAVGAV